MLGVSAAAFCCCLSRLHTGALSACRICPTRGSAGGRSWVHNCFGFSKPVAWTALVRSLLVKHLYTHWVTYFCMRVRFLTGIFVRDTSAVGATA